MKHMNTIIMMLVLTTTVSAHHSDAGLDVDSILAFEGTVTEFGFRNPHVYVDMETMQSGEPVIWSLQMGTANGLRRRGWTNETLVPGDRVFVRVHPALDGRPYAVVESIQKQGGLILAGGVTLQDASNDPEVPPESDSIAGIWRVDATKLVAYPGGFDGFFHANLKLTEQGAAAQSSYDPLSAENPESTCLGRPTPGAIVSTTFYLLEIQIEENLDSPIIIRSEYFDEERIIHMDGREHPPATERLSTGHSIGRWEEDTLVVDTTNFTDHRSPYQIGVPSGIRKHVIERYRLISNGTRMIVEFTLDDPDYIAEPMTHQRELIYSPQEQFFSFNCDLNASGRFVRP